MVGRHVRVLVIGLLAVACGGNVAVSSKGAGGAGATTTATGTTTGTGTGAGGGTSTGTGGGGTGGAAQTFDACARASDCVLDSATCCGTCGKPGLGDVTGVAASQEPAYRSAICAGSQGCPGCASQANPALGVRCDASHCKAFDAAALSTCQAEGDCLLRHGADCCEKDCSDFTLVAVSKTVAAQISTWTCGGATCTTCPGDPNSKAYASCQAGLCVVMRPP